MRPLPADQRLSSPKTARRLRPLSGQMSARTAVSGSPDASMPSTRGMGSKRTRTLGGRDRMMTTISFTLPAPVTARDLPDGLAPLAEAGPGESTVLRSESPLAHLHMLSEWALGRGFDVPDLDVHRPGLEEVYLSLTSSTSTKESS